MRAEISARQPTLKIGHFFEIFTNFQALIFRFLETENQNFQCSKHLYIRSDIPNLNFQKFWCARAPKLRKFEFCPKMTFLERGYTTVISSFVSAHFTTARQNFPSNTLDISTRFHIHVIIYILIYGNFFFEEKIN